MNQDDATPQAPVINSNMPLSQQTGAILKLMEEEPKEEPKKEQKAEPKVEAKEEVKEEKPQEPEFLPEDYDDEEPTPQTPFTETLEQYGAKQLKPIQVNGVQNGEAKTYTVYTSRDLPADFEYNNTREASQYAELFIDLKLKAERVQQEYYQKEQGEKLRQFEVQEAKDVANDLKWLQSRGVAPKFQYEDDDSRFNSDPAVKEVNEIYDLYRKVNGEYAQKYIGTGRSYRISFRDAADKYYAQKVRQTARNPKEEPKADKTPIQKQRDTIAGKSSPSTGEDGTVKPKAFQGMSFNDINRLAKAGKI